jgi:hypothetical protein
MLYETWLVIAGLSAALNFIGIGRLLSGYEDADYSDLVSFIAASIVSFVAAAASGSVDVIVACTTQSNSCILPYGGEIWALGAFFALGILDVGLAFVSLVLMFNRIRKSRGY